MIFQEGFESGEWTHQCRVFPVDGEPYNIDIGNIFTPKNWTCFFKHDPGAFDQPEAHNIWKSVDPRRIHSGEGAYMLFSFYRRHDAGIMRYVAAVEGETLKLTAWAHAWSNHNLEGHEDCLDDGRCSCGVNKKVVAIPAEDIPKPTGDPWNDAIGNSIFMVGIDPNGGEDPFSLDVEWGPAFAIYNGYAGQLEAEATVGSGGAATIFLRHITKWGFKHNDGYWDDVELVVVGGEEPPPEERGRPRVQYERTYGLLPPGADEEWALAFIEATWGTHRWTLGGSADDAGIGDLDVRRVIAVNPADWGSGLAEFFAEHYPNIEYVPVEASTPDALVAVLRSL